jgi:hypothetical protein
MFGPSYAPEQLQNEFDIQPGETNMLIADIPDIPPQQVPIVIAAKANQSSTEGLYGSVGVCTVADKTGQVEREKQLGVRLYASTIFDHKNPHYRAYYESIYAHAEDKSLLKEAIHNEEIDYRFIRDKNASVTVLEQPEHGKLSKDFSQGKDVSYYPNPGYEGTDKAVFLVNMSGYKVKAAYYISVQDVDFDNDRPESIYNEYCPDPNSWKISTVPNAGATTIGMDSPVVYASRTVY